MKVQIRIARSKEWVAGRRLATGDNVPDEVLLDVDPAKLSLSARTVLLANGNGEYHHFNGSFGEDYRFSCHAWYGLETPIVNAVAPTAGEISDAIVAADNNLGARRIQHLLERERRRVEREEEERRKAEAAAKLEQARLLLKDELEELRADLKSARADRKTLGEFLAAVPADALRGTLKAIAHSDDAIEELKVRVENASPVTVFDEGDDDE